MSEYDSETIHQAVKIIVYDNLGEWNITSIDMDNDGVCNNLDNCPQDYNPDQEDFDMDNIGDACDGIQIIEKAQNKKLIKSTDLLGRQPSNKGFQLHIYDDGSVERKCLIK